MLLQIPIYLQLKTFSRWYSILYKKGNLLYIQSRCVAIYEISCVTAFSAGWFAEGPRPGVFEKVKFILSKKAKKENN